MTNTVDGNRQLEGSLHNDPAAYWCPRCWQFIKGCEHLVPSLKKRLVPIDDWLIHAVRYDHERRILEVHLHAGGAYQHFGVIELAFRMNERKSPMRGGLQSTILVLLIPFRAIQYLLMCISPSYRERYEKSHRHH